MLDNASERHQRATPNDQRTPSCFCSPGTGDALYKQKLLASVYFKVLFFFHVSTKPFPMLLF